MPYITEGEKINFRDPYREPETVGQLVYVLTRSAVKFSKRDGALRFVTIALVMGAFFCAALEFYRRVAAKYEDSKIQENGDVY